MLVDGIALAKGTEDFGAVKGDIILNEGGGDWCRSVWVWNDKVLLSGHSAVCLFGLEDKKLLPTCDVDLQ